MNWMKCSKFRIFNSFLCFLVEISWLDYLVTSIHFRNITYVKEHSWLVWWAKNQTTRMIGTAVSSRKGLVTGKLQQRLTSRKNHQHVSVRIITLSQHTDGSNWKSSFLNTLYLRPVISIPTTEALTRKIRHFDKN